MAQVNLKEAYIRYLNSLNSGCDDEIERWWDATNQ